ncbi:MAG: ATP-binding protein [Deltaproteobacteria bacterium]|nr:ATP-binding protein [Deltaproteobacteria bacterium]MBW2571244.1 ATP-binding protein [Deltaproteobacteria bacterium]
MIPRPEPIRQIEASFQIHPVTALLGPRQCGKTTLALFIAEQEPTTIFDLENPIDIQRLSAPMQALKDLSGLVIIDEVQRKPELFELLRVLVDRSGRNARFLLLGSASPYLVKGVSESLAGRIGFVDLAGFQLWEVGVQHLDRLWIRGGLPKSFLADSESDSTQWREGFIRTFLERDIPQLGITIAAETLRRFWTMVAHYHGQVWNAAEFARALGTAENTARRYLDILTGAYMVRVLPPWFENLKKRQVKAPKIYIHDSGLFHSLLQVSTLADLRGHPKIGASWEGFALEHIIRVFRTRDAYFWATHAGAELDLMVTIAGKRHGFEFKYTDAPGRKRSMHIAIEDLGLEHLWVIYPGDQKYALDSKITAIPLEEILQLAQTGLMT